MRLAVAAAVTAAGLAGAAPAAGAPSDPGVVSYAVLGKGSVGNIVGAPIAFESVFSEPFQAFWVDLPVCNNWADIGLPEVYLDPDLASFNGAVAQTSANDQRHLVKQAVGVFATGEAAAGIDEDGLVSPEGEANLGGPRLAHADQSPVSGSQQHAAFGPLMARHLKGGHRAAIAPDADRHRPSRAVRSCGGWECRCPSRSG